MNRKFGIKHIGLFFQETFSLSESGLVFKGKEYEWKDIIFVHVDDKSGRFPSSAILLSDGEVLRIPTNLSEEHHVIKPKFEFIAEASAPYQEVIDILRDKFTSACVSDHVLLPYVHAYNYIMLYRIGLSVSLLLLLSNVLAVALRKGEIDQLLILLMLFSALMICSFAFLCIKRHRDEKHIKTSLLTKTQSTAGHA